MWIGRAIEESKKIVSWHVIEVLPLQMTIFICYLNKMIVEVLSGRIVE